MADDQDHTQKGSNSGSSSGKIEAFGRSCRKPKPKKVPQRGLGVAQLEKILLEEQQKKDAADVAAVSATILPSQSLTTLPPTSHKSSYLSLPIPSFSPPVQSASSCSSPLIPFPADFSSPNASVNSVPLLPGPGHAVNHKFWSFGEHNLEKQSSGLDPDLAFRTNLVLAHESDLLWPLPSLMQKTQQFQQSSSSMVNLASTTSSASSLMNFQMEPPSNQSYYGNVVMPLMPDEEKKVGIKRLYPFTLDNPPGPSFPYKVPPMVHSVNTSYESTSDVNGGGPNLEPGNSIFREMPLCSTSILDSYTNMTFMENGLSNGDFLTLAPPCKSSKLKQPSSHLAFYNYEPPSFTSLPYKASLEDSDTHQHTSVLHPQQPYFSFLPPAVVQFGHATSSMNNWNGGEGGEGVDLDLKL